MATRPAQDTSDQVAEGSHAGRRRNGLGTAALVIGVVSLVLAILIIFSPLSLPLGIISVIFGVIGILRANRGEADNRGQAIAGVVTGVLSVVIAVSLGITFVTFFTEHQGDLRKFGTCMSSADNYRERAPCIRDLGKQIDD